MVGQSPNIYDYIVVGSGAGGGTVAARLAEAGYSVIVLEAGGDAPEDCEVPAFHALASENDAIAWDFFVHHYGDVRDRRDEKFVGEWNGRRVNGFFYPRASCVGGCTAHNAMIFIAPPDCDWDAIATLTGDESWCAANMAPYLSRLENCHYRLVPRLLAKFGLRTSGHGWNGWLRTEHSLPREALEDGDIVRAIANAALEIFETSRDWLKSLHVLLRSFGDPNDRAVLAQAPEGIFYTPLSTAHHRRNGTRERLKEAERRFGLRVETDALATRVLLNEHKRAEGVEFLKGANLYRAHRKAQGGGEFRQIFARREVILSAGAFNTPQLLMLSGIGPQEELKALGIGCLIDLPDVGRNLQDRYEASVVYRMKEVWPSLRNAQYRRGDPLWRQWSRWGLGMYGSNGAALSVAKKSSRHKGGPPDLFLMSLLAYFRGYVPGYSEEIREKRNYLTWCILKAHTANRAGTVKLRSADAAEPPEINFNYFDDDPGHDDLGAVVEGVHTVRKIMAPLLECGMAEEEEVPGNHHECLEEFVRDNAWGHHACGTCAIGNVLTSDFRVRGGSGLRVVDASVFPRIPGYFIASAVYMIGEKAADAILADAMVIRPPGAPEIVPAEYPPVERRLAAE